MLFRPHSLLQRCQLECVRLLMGFISNGSQRHTIIPTWQRGLAKPHPDVKHHQGTQTLVKQTEHSRSGARRGPERGAPEEVPTAGC